MAEKPKAKQKHKLRFRFSIVFLSFLLSFMLCFIAYVNSLEDTPTSAYPAMNSNVQDNSLHIQENSDDSKAEFIITDEMESDNQEETLTDETESDEISQESSDDSSETVNNNENIENPVPESERKDDSYLNECVFVGDSISTGISGYGFVSEKNVFAQTSMRIDLINTTSLDTFYGNVLATEAIKSANPAHVYIMLGSNGMGWIDNSKMISDYSTFIDSVKESVPTADIYIMSIPPVTAGREAKPSVEEGKILNLDINTYNSMLLDLANEKNVYYIDTHSALMGSDGKLPSEVSTDGMHFIKDTYVKMIDYILTHTAG